MTAEAPELSAAEGALIEWMVEVDKRLDQVAKDLRGLREAVHQLQHQGGI